MFIAGSTQPAVAKPRILRDYWLLTVTTVSIAGVFGLLANWSLLPTTLAVFLVMLCIYPTVRYTIDRPAVVPAAPLLAAAYAIQFALPVFFGDGTLWLVGGYKALSEDSQVAALLIANVAMIGFLAITYSRTAIRLVNRLPVVDLHLNPTRALFYCLFFGPLAVLASRIYGVLTPESQTQLAALFKVLQSQLLVAIGVLGWLSYTQRSVWLRLVYFLFIAAAVAEGLASGFLEAVLMPIGIMFASQWIYTRKINKVLAACMVALMLLLNPVKGDYRETVWYSGGGPQGAWEKAALWLDSGINYWGQVLQGRASGDDAAAQLVRRTSMIDLVAHVYDTTPTAVPYLMGETYSYFAYSLIPRVLWPDKPVTTANRELAIAYSLTTPEGAERSTFGISLIGEGYANFGWAGSIFIMVLVGFVLLAFQRMFATRSSGPGGYALFMAFFFYFLNGLGSSAEILLGSLLQSMLVSSVFIYWVSEKRQRLQLGDST
jgi:hypothetical protein